MTKKEMFAEILASLPRRRSRMTVSRLTFWRLWLRWMRLWPSRGCVRCAVRLLTSPISVSRTCWLTFARTARLLVPTSRRLPTSPLGARMLPRSNSKGLRSSLKTVPFWGHSLMVKLDGKQQGVRHSLVIQVRILLPLLYWQYSFLLSWASPSGDAFLLESIGAFLRAKTPKFPLYHTPHFLSREKLHKVFTAKIPKLV